ncbi:MAG: ABC-type Fe3+ transport system substrate-binding protein [Lentimonas sp.]|jgi:ABC-type Fe3+ transport system substrate-binding protein
MFRPIVFLLSLIAVLTLQSCVEYIEPEANKTVTIHTDMLSLSDSRLFEQFTKKSGIKVKIVSLPLRHIQEDLRQFNIDSEADIILLSKGLDLIELKEKGYLYSPKKYNPKEYWQPLCIDPFILEYLADTVYFNSFKQILNDSNALVDVYKVDDFAILGHLMDGLTHLYPQFTRKKLYATFLKKNKYRTNQSKYVSVNLYSQRNKELDFVFPDQNKFGTLGVISGMAIHKRAKQMYNALLLYEYCRSDVWRTKMAKRTSRYPVLRYKENLKRTPRMYQIPPVSTKTAYYFFQKRLLLN